MYTRQASAASKHQWIPYRNTPPSVWSSGLSWLASLHIAGHQLMHAVKVVSCHAGMAHAVLYHQLLHFTFDIPHSLGCGAPVLSLFDIPYRLGCGISCDSSHILAGKHRCM